MLYLWKMAHMKRLFVLFLAGYALGRIDRFAFPPRLVPRTSLIIA